MSQERPTGTLTALPFDRVLRVGPEGLSIDGPGGVELCVVFTELGPVVRLRGARVEIEAAEELRLTARRVVVQGQERVDLASSGELALSARADLTLHAEADLKATAEMIHLN